jgi:hypothetical protein
MTDVEWTACTDPDSMIEYLRNNASDRKIRLFVVACCRRIAELMPHEWSRRAVEVGERFADGHASEQERAAAREAAFSVDRLISSGQVPEVAKEFLFYRDRIIGGANYIHASYAAGFAVDKPGFTINPDGVEVFWGVRSAAHDSAHAVADVDLTNDPDRNPSDEDGWWTTDVAAYEAERVAQCELLRDIFDNLFRSITVSRSWLTPRVLSLGQAIYDKRAFGRMPELAGLLQQAGCNSQEILAHCCASGQHARGCWVLDLVLGKQ